MLSIMGGEWRGRKLFSPDRHELRPTAGRVKAAIFSILESQRMKEGKAASFSEAICLDLFAGVGGLGFEALSRGAERCVFVEKERDHFRALKKNAQTLGCVDRVVLVESPVERCQKFLALHGPFDYVFMDPPYNIPKIENYLQFVAEHVVLKDGAIIVFEHGPNEQISALPKMALHSERKLGPAGLSIFIYRP